MCLRPLSFYLTSSFFSLCSDLIKAVQSTQIHKPAVREVLDSMHMYLSRVDFWGASHTNKQGNPTGYADYDELPQEEAVSDCWHSVCNFCYFEFTVSPQNIKVTYKHKILLL